MKTRMGNKVLVSLAACIIGGSVVYAFTVGLQPARFLPMAGPQEVSKPTRVQARALPLKPRITMTWNAIHIRAKPPRKVVEREVQHAKIVKRKVVATVHQAAAEHVPAGVMARFANSATADEDLVPQLPNKFGVAGVMRSARSRVQRCYERGMVPGLVVVSMTINGTGRVIGATVSPSTSTATCVRAEVAKLRFAPFRRSRTSVRYRYHFR